MSISLETLPEGRARHMQPLVRHQGIFTKWMGEHDHALLEIVGRDCSVVQLASDWPQIQQPFYNPKITLHGKMSCWS